MKLNNGYNAKHFVLAAFSLLVIFTAFATQPELVTPEDGATLSTLTEPQKTFVEMAPLVRRVKFADSSFRSKVMGLPLENVGGLSRRAFWPKSVKLAWKPVGEEARVKVKDIVKDCVVYEKTTTDSFIYVDNLENSAEYEWTVSIADASASRKFKTEDQPIRLVRFPGVNNARDLGGKKGFDGHRIRQGLLFRSASLAGGEDGKYIRDRFGIKSDIDLRDNVECKGTTCSPLGADVKWFHCPSSSYGAMQSKIGKDQFSKIFRLLLNETNYPAVFHGEKGEDRTGSLSFVLLGLLGCDGNIVVLDWEVSGFRNRAAGWNHYKYDSLESSFAKFYGGNSPVVEMLEKYVLDCGFSIDDIVKFRKIMLE